MMNEFRAVGFRIFAPFASTYTYTPRRIVVYAEIFFKYLGRGRERNFVLISNTTVYFIIITFLQLYI